MNGSPHDGIVLFYPAMTAEIRRLRADLIARWEAAFDRLAELETAAAVEAETVVYTRHSAYSLDGYSPKRFKPGTRLSRLPISPGDDYVYRLDAEGRPIHVQHEHRFNRVRWEGFFTYRRDQVEYLSFCLETKVPNEYGRLALRDGVVVSSQRFLCNSGGAWPALAEMAAEEAANEILGDSRLYFIFLTDFHVEDGLPRSADVYPAGGSDSRRLEYEYSDARKLERIIEHRDGKPSRTEFVAKSKVSERDLEARLSGKIADEIMAQLRAMSLSSPLVAVEMTYLAGQHHIPSIIAATVEDRIESLSLVTQIDASRWVELDEEQFAPDITEFNQRVEAAETWAPVARLLSMAARRVTADAEKHVRVAEGFIAFAVDWELDGHQLEATLERCGASREQLRKFAKAGWL